MRYMGWAALAAAVILSATHVAAHRPRHRTIVIGVDAGPGETCRVSLLGDEYSLPNDERRLRDAARRVRAGHPQAELSATAAIPYRCVGQAFYLLQASGFRRVSFAAERPRP